MAKRFRLHLSRFLNSCRSSSSSSTATYSTIPSPKQPNPPTSSPSSDHHHFHHNTPHSSTTSSSSSSSTSFLNNPIWHVPSIPSPRCKIDSSDDADHLFPPLSLPKPSYRKTMQHLRSTTTISHHKKNKTKNSTKKKKKKKKKRDHPNPSRTSSSSLPSSSPDNTVWFSSDGGETDTLIAGCGDSRRTRKNVLLKKMMVTCTEEKVKGSFAVVKRSDDPYGDFKRSMVEMVTGRHLYEKSELRELLRCFLSLNSTAHHDAILRAFSEVCHAMFLAVDPHSPR